MDVLRVEELAGVHLGLARKSDNGRSATTLYGRGGARLRQTLIALDTGQTLGEHQSPGDASLMCLQGEVVLRSGDTEVELRAGELMAVPPQRHDVHARAASVLLLSVALH
ncbi:MAG: cupin domain-containing protein [Kribbellaceae bacterium]|nr:cupin domain-containing protein [Kribbellaceae bacterium]